MNPTQEKVPTAPMISSDSRDLIQIRRGNQADLPILAQGEQGITLDTEKLYIGGLNGNIEFQSGKAIDDELEAFKKKIRLSLKDFGAVGDGTTDDSSAVTSWINALDSSDNIGYIPPGNYIINSSVTTPENVIIEGAGVKSILIFETGGLVVSDYTVIRDFQVGTKATDSTGVQLKGLKSTAKNITLGTGAPNAAWNIGVSVDNEFTIVDNINLISINSAGTGILLQATAGNTTINNCYLVTGGATGIYITAGAETCYIVNTRISRYATAVSANASYCYISHNYIYDITGTCIHSAGQSNNINNNLLMLGPSATSTSRIITSTGRQTLISNNTCVSTSAVALNIYASGVETSITGNNIKSGLLSISVTASDSFIGRNTISGAPQAITSTSGGGIVTENIITANIKATPQPIVITCNAINVAVTNNAVRCNPDAIAIQCSRDAIVTGNLVTNGGTISIPDVAGEYYANSCKYLLGASGRSPSLHSDRDITYAMFYTVQVTNGKLTLNYNNARMPYTQAPSAVIATPGNGSLQYSQSESTPTSFVLYYNDSSFTGTLTFPALIIR